MERKRRRRRIGIIGKVDNSLPKVCGKAASHTSLASLDRYRAKRLGLPIPASHVVDPPWGYIVDPEDPNIYTPVCEALQLLYQGVTLLKNRHTLVDVAEWLNCHEILEVYGIPELDGKSLAGILRTRPPFKEVMLPLDERKRL